MRDEVELIELIDADPGAFGAVHPPVTTGEPPAHRLPSRRVRLTALCAALGAAAIVAGLFSWRPWAQNPRLVLADRTIPEPTLTARLVLGLPLTDVRATTLHGSDGTSVRGLLDEGAVGQILGEPGATLNRGDGTDRWLGFFAVPAGSAAAPTVVGQGLTIAGAPAEISSEDGTSVQLAWGPVGGWVFTAAGAGVSKDDAVAIVGQLRIEGGRPVVVDRSVLDGLQPLGGFGDYLTVMLLTQYTHDNGRAPSGLTALYYGFNTESIVSAPGNASALDLMPFVLPSVPHEGTVHSLRAIGYTVGAGPFGTYDVSSVIWWEGGRLVMVTTTGQVEAAFALAETTRVATDQEWSTVQRVD